MRPQSIVRFEQAYLASVVVWLINLVLNWDTRLAALDRDPRFSGNPQMAQIAEWAMVGSAAFGFVLWLLIWYFIARRAVGWLKWVLVVFLLISAAGLPFAIMSYAVIGMVSTALTVVGFLLSAVAVWMLFKPDAKAWLSGEQTVEATAQPFE